MKKTNPEPFPTKIKEMSQDQKKAHMMKTIKSVAKLEAEDTIGTVVLMFQDNGQLQYAATVQLEGVAQALRNLADTIDLDSHIDPL